MPIRLPAHFRAWSVSDEACIAFSRGNNQKSGNGIYSVSQTFAPLKYPIDRSCNTTRQRHFSARMHVDKVDGTRAGRGEDAKIIALREQRIEGAERVLPRIVAA